MNIKKELIFKRVDRTVEDLETIRGLYDRSFPDNERIPFDWLLKSKDPLQEMCAAYEDKMFVGMYYLYFKDELIYLSYICVMEELRDLGYGSKILSKIKDRYLDRRIVIDIEEVREGDKDHEHELKRRAFYLKNGFFSTEIFYHIYGVDYELLSFGGKVNKDEWHSLIRHHWGRIADTAIYRDANG